MAWASITNNLGLGRYRIRIDSGESRRVALVAAANQGLALVGSKITASYVQVQLADQLEATSREAINTIIDALVLESDPTAVGLAQKVLAIEQQKYARLVSSNVPVRLQYASLKDAQADLVRQRAKWEALQTITYKDVWCADYTLEASGDVVPTIDIPGDPSLTLLAPSARTFVFGDGTISTARKAAALDSRAKQLIRAGQNLADINARLTTARAEEITLRAEVTSAQTAYVTTPTDANYTAFERKTAELAAKRHDIANLTISGQQVAVTVGRLNQEIAYWTARPASEVPVPGDGVFLDRSLLSPAQAYFNAAIFPGWQKWMPTYRWGTASDVDDDANTMTVTLGSATSSAQSLGVNSQAVLYRVPITYMTCNSNAFFDGDRVVVQFENQQLASPRVIGFLDNPKECILHNYIITGYDGVIESYLGKKAGFEIPPHTAPRAEELTPSNIEYYGERAVGVFLGWFKTVGIGADPLVPYTTSYILDGLRVSRSDPISTVGPTVYTANYYLFPQFITGQYWDLEYLSHDNRTEWDLTAVYQPQPDDPINYTWYYVVKGTVTSYQPIRLYFGTSLLGPHIEVSAVYKGISPTGIEWTSAEDPSIYQGFIVFNDPPGPGPTGIFPGEQLHPEDWDPPWYASIAPRPDLAAFAPTVVLETIYGTAIYALDAALTSSIARWKIQGVV